LKIASHQLQDLTALEKLFINDFNAEEFEEALPTLISFLQYLRIELWKNLKYLQGSKFMQHLSKLIKQIVYLGISLFFQKIVAMAMALS
jgi:hypothetical protein